MVTTAPELSQFKGRIQEVSSESPTWLHGPKDLDYQLLFSLHTQGAGSEVEEAGLEPVPLWDASSVGRGLAC